MQRRKIPALCCLRMLEDVKEINVWKDTMVKVFWISQLMISSNICQAQRMRRDRARFRHTPSSLPPCFVLLLKLCNNVGGTFLPSLAPVFFLLRNLVFLVFARDAFFITIITIIIITSLHYFHFILGFLGSICIRNSNISSSRLAPDRYGSSRSTCRTPPPRG